MGVNDFNMNEFLNRLGFILRKRRMNKQDFARILGVAPNTISRWFAKKACPSAETLFKICWKLGVSADWLLNIERVVGGNYDDYYDIGKR
ncbi:MAG: helix-turn-helix domain-containing protein [Bacteroidales bacterium]|nr:helix-turn-helix domain-containing protein [Bacteroidales bacterium]